MSEWWTYSLSDFLMFSSRTYWRLIALYNQDIWPAHIIAIAVGLVIIGCLVRPTVRTRRVALLLLGAAWAWVGWAYHLERYATISTAGPYFAAAFALQALILCLMAARAGNAAAAHPLNSVGLTLSVLAVLAYPLLALTGERAWEQAEVFGIAPDPTVAATLGVLLVLRVHWTLWPIPVLWCAASSATLMELRVGHAWLLPIVAGIAIAAGLLALRRSRSLNSTTNSPP